MSQDEFTSFSETPLWSGGPPIIAIGAKSAEGEVLDFNREVTMKENVEGWLESLLTVTKETIADRVYEVDRDIKNGTTVEDISVKVTQACLFNIFPLCIFSELQNHDFFNQQALRLVFNCPND